MVWSATWRSKAEWLVPLAVPTPYLFCLVKREGEVEGDIDFSFVSFLISLEPRNDMSRKETRELDPTWYMFWTIVFIHRSPDEFDRVLLLFFNTWIFQNPTCFYILSVFCIVMLD